MRTIIRPSRYAALVISVLAVVGLALLLAWVVMIVWIKGGPQPLHPIVIALPAPAAAGRHT